LAEWVDGYLLNRPDQMPQRPDRLIVFFDHTLREKRVPDVWIPSVVRGWSMRDEILCHDVR
jgi:hypothetical protein